MSSEGGDAFWRAFTLRACEYANNHNVAKLEDLERIVKTLAPKHVPVCGHCQIYNTSYVACSRCNKNLSCGRSWCGKKDGYKTCGTCYKQPFCDECVQHRKCGFEGCIEMICNGCRVLCNDCNVWRCPHHVTICPDCKKLICDGCKIHNNCSVKKVKSS